MISFLKGRIDSATKETVVIDVNDIGYKVYVARASSYEIGSTIKLLTYDVQKQDESYLVGFPSAEEKNLFLTLIKIQGIGAKTALAMFSVGSPQDIISAINHEDIKYLKSLPLVGYKTARQIILELKGYFVSSESEEEDSYSDVRKALITLGFKSLNVDTALRNVYKEGIDKEELLKLAIKEVRKL
ncbi:MAG: Holliday junction branch migration protein RuvA [Bacilli bacterium]|nr:Holliday junction branch migration protein RuvA [Bacilli bacterium]